MEASDQLWVFFRSLLQQLPSLLTLVGCIIFSVILWKRHPKVSLFAVVSLLLLLIHEVVFAAVFIWVPRWFLVDRSPTGSYHTVMLIIRLAYNTTLALALGLLLTAIFMRRRPATAS